jgi:hypothetical protein
MNDSAIHLAFAHAWDAEILPARPLILPPRHFVYPREVEEVERGALEVMVRPRDSQPFLATCALGFRDPAAASGVWAVPHPLEICCVSGGYAYVIDTRDPEQFAFLPLRPVLEVRTAADAELLLFVGHRAIVAWGADGQQWESEKLSDEGVTVTTVGGWILRGMGWSLMADKETPFLLDLHTGRRTS